MKKIINKFSKTKILFLLTFCFIFLIGINTCSAISGWESKPNITDITGTAEVWTETQEFDPEVPIPGFTGGTINGALLGNFINGFYNYIVWLAGILAVIVIMIAGFQWVTAAGNQSKIGEAKERITGAIIGLVLALSSFMLLNIINPDLVKIQDLSNLVPITAMDTHCKPDQYVSYNGQDIIGSDLECNHKANILDGKGKKTDFTCDGLDCSKDGVHAICYEKQCRGIYTACSEAFENDGELGIGRINNLVTYYNKIEGECIHWQTYSSSMTDPYDNVGFCDQSYYEKAKKAFYTILEKHNGNAEEVCPGLELYGSGVDVDEAACKYLVCRDIPECSIGQDSQGKTICEAK